MDDLKTTLSGIGGIIAAVGGAIMGVLSWIQRAIDRATRGLSHRLDGLHLTMETLESLCEKDRERIAALEQSNVDKLRRMTAIEARLETMQSKTDRILEAVLDIKGGLK